MDTLVRFSLFFGLFLPIVEALPEQGIWNITTSKDQPFVAVAKSLYNSSKISVKILCDESKEGQADLTISWVLRWTPCAEEYIGLPKLKTDQAKNRVYQYVENPELQQIIYNYKTTKYVTDTMSGLSCGSHEAIVLNDLSNQGYIKRNTQDVPAPQEQPKGKQKRAAASENAGAPKVNKTTSPPSSKTTKHTTSPPGKTTPANSSPKMKAGPNIDGNVVASTWEDGVYLFAMELTSSSKFNATVTIMIKGPQGYLSAIDWPLLPFYAVMCVVYVIYGIVWIVLISCNWRDILRIQFWVGGVIFLGMLEKAVFLAEYESINSTGISVRGAVVFAELVSCLKRTLARMLVIIVSLGFGIVKPRLGPTLHKVLAVGFLYFVLGSIEGCLRVLSDKGDVSNQQLIASVPLAVLDAAICWWIFTSLVQTTRTLRLRRNLVKLSLYRHFTNTLIFTVLASVVFMIWSIKQHKITRCLTDWKELWVDDAFWHLLFSTMLAVIMFLWRPTNNNQRYAFSPLLDAAEDEEENEPMMNDAFDGMKLRGGKTKIEYPDSPTRDAKSKAEDDLKWIEENIPASVADTALPSLLDSDEEIMTTKFEMSKME